MENNQLKIGFDMDGVILDNADSKIKVARKLGFTIKLSHTPAEILRKMMPQIVWEEFQSILYNHPSFAFSTPLMRGAKNVIAGLKARNIPIYLISRRKLPEIASKVLEKHSLWPQYFNEKNSFFVDRATDKNKQAAKLGLTHFIDDELANISVLSKVPNRFLFDKFNVFKNDDKYVKVKSLSEFKKHIKI
jgi:hypothetical protein